jgi:type I restriction enzyme S subunit
MNQETTRQIDVPAPSVDEQTQIVEVLDEEVQKIARLILKVESAIDRLTEYRTALITAATTGKIDVRKVKIPQPVA